MHETQPNLSCILSFDNHYDIFLQAGQKVEEVSSNLRELFFVLFAPGFRFRSRFRFRFCFRFRFRFRFRFCFRFRFKTLVRSIVTCAVFTMQKLKIKC
jgi:hypothetical protein